MNKKNSQLRVQYAQAVYDDREIERVLNVLKERRTGVGRETEEFERRVCKQFGKKYGVMVNSGSSANILAFDLINLPEGSEVITSLLTFSTTVSPIIQKKLIPVFTDVEPRKYTINISQIEELISKKTKAIMIPLIIGSVPDMEKLSKIAKKNNLFIIEDSCDTFGATFNEKPTGAYTDITTTSFYGSHIITAAAGGGMLMVNRKDFRDKALVLRGWGRRSALFNESENIKKRFGTRIGNVSYDAKFVFDERGYNFLPLEISAAFGNAQLKKLPTFRKIRHKNFNYLHKLFSYYEEFFVLPQQDKKVKTQWLAFPLTIKKTAPFSRLQLVTYLERHNIQTRPILTGNILHQPGFVNIPHKIVKNGCPITDDIMRNGFVIGCHQGLELQHLEKIKEVIKSFFERFSH